MILTFSTGPCATLSRTRWPVGLLSCFACRGGGPPRAFEWRCFAEPCADLARAASRRPLAVGGLEDFLRVFLDIRLPFVAFRGSTIRVLRVLPGPSDSLRPLGKFDDLGVRLQGIRRYPRPLVDGTPNDSLGPTTSNSINRGLAAMPARERSIAIEERALAAINLSAGTERQWLGILRPRGRIRVPRPTSRSGMMRPAGIRSTTRRRAIARAGCCPVASSGFHRLGDRFEALQRRLTGERWVKRLAIVIGVLAVIFATCFGGLWWRLGAGPINLDMATPWLAAAIEDNIGHGNTVEVGGTQIERAGRIRIAVRIRDIVVRDRDQVVVATAPKAEVKLSGTALLMGRLRAESLNLVDAELAVRITPDGQVTVSAGDTAKPLATGVASKRDAGLAPTFPRPAPAPAPGARGDAALRRHDAERIAGRPRLARQPQPDRPRRAEPQRDRPQERQSHRRRPAARQQMDISRISASACAGRAAAASR